MFLAINTCDGDTVQVGLFDQSGDLKFEESVSSVKEHASVFFDILSQKINRSDLLKVRKGGVIVLEGPGPFTSCRIGVTAANAIAISLTAKIYSFDLYNVLDGVGLPKPYYFDAGKGDVFELFEFGKNKKYESREGVECKTGLTYFLQFVEHLIRSGNLKQYEKLKAEVYYVKDANISISKKDI